jgi:hypothetical protein
MLAPRGIGCERVAPIGSPRNYLQQKCYAHTFGHERVLPHPITSPSSPIRSLGFAWAKLKASLEYVRRAAESIHHRQSSTEYGSNG